MMQLSPHTASYIPSLRTNLRSIVRMHGFMSSICENSGLPHSHTHALIELESSARRAKELQLILQLDKSTISRMISSLASKGLINQQPGLNDKREKILTLSSKGKKLVTKIHCKVNAQTKEVIEQLSEQEISELVKGLQKYSRAMNRVIAQRRIVVRTATSGDDAELAKIIIQTLDEHGELKPGTIGFDPEVHHLSRALNGKQSRYFVAELDGIIIGGAGIGPTNGLPKGTCELKRMFIRKEARGLGLGKLLMDACLNQARTYGYKKCYLETLEGLVVARKFYEQEGFKYLSAPLGNSGHTACQYWMIKNL